VLTVVFDLTVALEVAMVLACILFVQRMGSLFRVELKPQAGPVLDCALHGALFFGAVAKLDPLLSRVEAASEATVLHLDMTQLHALDLSGLEALEQVRRALEQRRGRIELSGLHGEPLAVMTQAGWLHNGSLASPQPGPS
jgi:SulP family sulfate permease